MKNLNTYLIMICLLTACYRESDYDLTNLKLDEVILNINIENNTILANGISSTKISVELPLKSAPDLSSVKLITSNGKFKENNLMEITKDAKQMIINGKTKKVAEFILISSTKAENAGLEVNVQDVKKIDTVYFKFNYPDKIKTTPSALFIIPSKAEEINITSKISCTKGSPSFGQEVNMSVKDSAFNKIGTFRIYNNISNESNETLYTYSLFPNTTYIGKLFIISFSKKGTTSISDTVIIYSKN